MKLQLRLYATLLLLTTHPVAAETIAIVNVNVVPMTEEIVLEDQTVLVDGDRIVALGSVDAVPVPDDAQIIDGTDRYLLPGLTEMHGHVTSTEPQAIERLFGLFLANGVTTVRGMLGRPSHLELRQDIEAGRVLGPRLITSGPSFNGNSVSSASQAEAMVQDQHRAGYDFLKIHPGMSAGEFEAMADAANALGMPFAGHVPVAVGVAGALEKGMATIDHLDGYLAAMLPAQTDSSGGYGGFFGVMLADQVIDSRIDEVARETVAAGVANVPTETLFEQLVDDESPAVLANRIEMRYMPQQVVRQWVDAKEQTLGERGFDADVAARAIDIRRRLIHAIQEAGGTILLGSDAPQVFNVPGFSLHRELELMVAAGLTPFEALYAGTRAPAAFFGLETGAVEVGRVADLALLDANPLEDIENSRRVHGVMVRGRWAESAELLGQIR